MVPGGPRHLAHRSTEPMTLIHDLEDTAAGHQGSAVDPGEGASHRPTFRSQANAPCLPRSGRSYFC